MSLTEDALAIAFRTGLPFVGLRDHAHDPDLDRLIPPDAARTARAIPLTADDDRIRLAVADPDTDLSTLDQYLAGRQIDLALAPREEIDTILGPPPPRGEEPEHLASAGAEAIATEEPRAGEVDAEEPEALAEAEPEPQAESEPERLAAEPEPLAAEGAAPTEAAPFESEPEPVADAEPRPEPLAIEPDSLIAEPEPQPAAEPEPVAAEPEPELIAASADADRAALADADAELAGEVPSWLEPQRRRWWRVVLTVLFVLVVLALAAVAVVVFVNA